MNRIQAELFVEAIYELAHDTDKTVRERADDRERLIRMVELLPGETVEE